MTDIAFTDAAPTRGFTDADVTSRAAEYATRDNFWIGWSGEPVSGADVSDHIGDVATLLTLRGWVRTTRDDEPEIPEADASMSVKELLLAGLRALRSLVAAPGPLTLMEAEYEIGRTSGDSDARVVADRVLDALVSAYTGSPMAAHNPWAEKRGRTLEEVRGLLEAAAEFSRTHGPRI